VSPLGARQEVAYLRSSDFGDVAGSSYPVVKSVTTTGPAMATGTVSYWYAAPQRISSGAHAGEYRGFSTTWSQDSGTGLVRRTSWDTASKPFIGSPLVSSLGTPTTAGSLTSPPTLSTFRIITSTHAARSIESGACTTSPTDPASTAYPLIPVTTSELDQRVVDGVTFGSKRTTPCASVDRWGNAAQVVVDPDTGVAGDELTVNSTFLVTSDPASPCKDCVKSRGSYAGTTLKDWTELGYDAAGRLSRVQRQSVAGQSAATYPVVADYSYQGNGNLASRTEGGATYVYTYDDWFQVRVARVEASDVVTLTKQLVTESSFDGAGRPVKVVGPYYQASGYPVSARPERHLGYDGLGRLVVVATQPVAGTSVTGGLAAFTYQAYVAAPATPASVTAYQFAAARSFQLPAPPQTEDARQVVTYLDGLGRTIQTRERLGGPAGDPAAGIVQPLYQGQASQYLVTGVVLLDGAGRVRASLAPYYSPFPAFRDPLSVSFAPGSGEVVKGPVQATWTGRDAWGRESCSTLRVVTGLLTASEPVAGACTSSFAEDGSYALATRRVYRGTSLFGQALLGVKTVEPRFTTPSGMAVGPESFVDAAGLLRRTEDAEGNRVRYLYDSLGRPTSTVREAPGGGRGSITSSVTLDMMGRVATRTDPNFGGRSFSYDAQTPGLLAKVRFTRTGEEIRYGYDLGRMTTVEFCTAGGACATDASLGWDLPYPGGSYANTAGQVASASNPRTTIAFAYDDGGAMVRRDQWVSGLSGGFAFTATRRADGRVLQGDFVPAAGMGLPPLSTVTGYDSAGRPARLQAGASTLWAATAASDGTGAYDAFGRLTGASVDGGLVEQSWSRGASSGLLVAQTVKIPGAANPAVYDVSGMAYRGTQLVGYTDNLTQTNHRYWYSQAGRLVAAQARDVATSGVTGLSCVGFGTSKQLIPGPSFGNIEVVREGTSAPVSREYGYPGSGIEVSSAGPDAATSVGTTSLTYDGYGRVASKGGGAEGFGYDLAGRLVSVARVAGPSETIGYDPFGLPVQRTVSGQVTWYLGRQATVTSVGGVLRADVHLTVNGERVASVRVGGSPRTQFLHRDRLTSVVATTLAGGVRGASYRYSPHGAVEAASGDAGDSASELGYAGALRLTGGLLWMGARVYDPSLKVFLQPDPLSPHSYTYASGDPVNRWDPTGMKDTFCTEVGCTIKFEDQAKDWPKVTEPETVITVRRDPPSNYFDKTHGNGQTWSNVTGKQGGGQPGRADGRYKVVAPRSGKVKQAGWENSKDKNQGYGLHVQIVTDVGLVTVGHLEEDSLPESLIVDIDVVAGETVIGVMGNTGDSKGPHVHVDLRPGGVMDLLSKSGGPITWSAPGWVNPLGSGSIMTGDYKSERHRGYDFVPGG